jgi:hypothetical protein
VLTGLKARHEENKDQGHAEDEILQEISDDEN